MHPGDAAHIFVLTPALECPESPTARPGPQRYVSNDPGDFKSNICDIYFTQIASRLTRIVGSLFVSGAMITSQAEWPGAGSGSQHTVPDEERRMI